MKKYIAIIGAVAFASAVTFAQDAAPIVIPTPQAATGFKPITMTLSPAQVTALATTLAGSGVTLPTGIKTLNLFIVTSGSNAGGAQVRISF